MFVIVVGAGQIGRSLARKLVSSGHEVSVVEQDPARCEATEDQLGSVTVVGDGTSELVLARAGANRADVLIAATRSDEDNLLACQMARHRFDVRRTMALVNVPEHGRLFDLLGIEASIDLTGLAVDRIQEHLALDGLIHVIPIPGINRRAFVTARLPRESPLVGRTVREIAVPEGVLVSLIIRRSGQAAMATDDILLQPEDEIVAVADVDDQERLVELFMQQVEPTG